MCGRDLKICQKAFAEGYAEGVVIGRAELLADRIQASIEIGLDEEIICKAFGITLKILDDFKQRYGWQASATASYSSAKNKHSSADYTGLN